MPRVSVVGTLQRRARLSRARLHLEKGGIERVVAHGESWNRKPMLTISPRTGHTHIGFTAVHRVAVAKRILRYVFRHGHGDEEECGGRFSSGDANPMG